MTATFTIRHHNRLEEDYEVACAHGATAMHLMTFDAEGMEASLLLVLARHRQRDDQCLCDPTALVDEWVRLADAQAQTAADIDKIAPGGRFDSPAAREGIKAMAEQLAGLGCIHCAPGFRSTTTSGSDTAILLHEDGCPAKVDPPATIVMARS